MRHRGNTLDGHWTDLPGIHFLRDQRHTHTTRGKATRDQRQPGRQPGNAHGECISQRRQPGNAHGDQPPAPADPNTPHGGTRAKRAPHGDELEPSRGPNGRFTGTKRTLHGALHGGRAGYAGTVWVLHGGQVGWAET